MRISQQVEVSITHRAFLPEAGEGFQKQRESERGEVGKVFKNKGRVNGGKQGRGFRNSLQYFIMIFVEYFATAQIASVAGAAKPCISLKCPKRELIDEHGKGRKDGGGIRSSSAS